jgi:cytochrome c oxidase subunit II
MMGLHHALSPAGPQAAEIAGLWWLTLGLCVVFGAAILVAVAWALGKAPRSKGAEFDIGAEPAGHRRARLAVMSGVALSTVGLLGLIVASVYTDRALARLPLQQAVNVEVVAHQWWWQVNYKFDDPSQEFSTANEMVIPVGRPVVVTLKADDVIHSFWVPNLGGKKDLIPGRTATLPLRADQPGKYRGQCAEFCGLQHAWMAFVVNAVSEADYAKWQEAQRKPAPEPADERQRRGRELFLSGSCMLCHAVQGTTANARKAPDLTHVAGREMLAAGRMPNTPDNLRSWISQPQKWKPGVNMPSHELPPEDLEAIVAYVGSLK